MNADQVLDDLQQQIRVEILKMNSEMHGTENGFEKLLLAGSMKALHGLVNAIGQTRKNLPKE